MKKKIIIMENANHYFNVKTYSEIFKKNFDVTLYLALSEDKKYIKKDCPEILDSTKFKIINAWNHKIFFLRALILKDFDYYFISWGIEHKKSYFILNYILFFIFTIFNKKKIIFRIGRSDSFFNSKQLKKLKFKDYKHENWSIFNSFFRFIRISSLNKIGYLTFETKTLLKYFKKITKFSCKHLVLKPCSKDEVIVKKFAYKNRLILGLHGGFDQGRRDYIFLIDELRKLNIKYRKKITLKFLGSSNIISIKNIYLKRAAFQNNIFKKLKKTGIKIIASNKGFISRSEYERSIKNVNLLIDIAKDDGHFLIKPTGLITDAQNFGKKILLNEKNDPYKEFKNLCIYYKSLSNCLKNIIDSKLKTPEKKIKFNNNFKLN